MFDTVNHKILISKLSHYSIRNKASNIIRSFLNNRYQYVSIDTIKSGILESPPCSVIQGSKLSALLYTLYINEVTVLQNLMNDELYTKITGLDNVVNYDGI